MHCNSPFYFSLIIYYKVEISLRHFHPIIGICLGWFFTCICGLPPKAYVFAQTYFHAYNGKNQRKQKRETDPGVPSLKKLMLCERSDVSSWMPYLRLNTQHWWKEGKKEKEQAHPFYCEFITTANKNRKIRKYDTPKHHVFFETVVRWGRSKKPYSTGCRNKIPRQMDCHSPPEANKPHTLL